MIIQPIEKGCHKLTLLNNREIMKNFKFLLAAVSLAFATSASAEIFTYNFGNNISGAAPASANFATLTFDDVISKFTLSLTSDFATLFGKSAFVGAFGVDYAGNNPTITGTVAGGGVKKVVLDSAGGPASTDFRYVFGNAENDRLVSGETVSWFSDDKTITKGEGRREATTTIAGFDVTKFTGGILHVQGMTGFSSGEHEDDGHLTSGWYSISAVSPVPEVETSSMMLLGLGLMGFIARRRRNGQV
jgi:hypothetical protein